jgi:hypothetical protein
MKTCGSPACRCAQDPAARHGPYYEWGHMKAGKLVHQLAHRRTGGPARLKKLLRSWERDTERLIDAQADRRK